MKKWIALLLSIAMMLCLVACTAEPAGSGDTQTTDKNTDETTGTDTQDTQSAEQTDADETDSQDATTGDTQLTKFVMGTSADYPPFEFIIINDKGEQEYVGIDISLAKKIAEDMGVELEVVNMSFENLMIALDKGEVDSVIAAVEEDEERALVADFSEPYYTDYPPMVLVKKANADQYTSLDSFAGKKVGAQMSTTKADIVTNDMTDANLVALSSVNDLVNELVYDKCDAIVLDGAVAMQYAESNSDLVVADVELGVAAPYRVTVKKGDPKGLLESINKTIATILEDGTMDAYIEEANELSTQALES